MMRCFLLRVVLVLCFAAVCAVAQNKEAGDIGGEIGEVVGKDAGEAIGGYVGDLVNPAAGVEGAKIGGEVGGEVGEVVGKDAGEEVANVVENDFEAGAAAPSSGVGSLWTWMQCVAILASLAIAY
ncbi:hypothetical protein M9434_001580 [Picochlorum sp. BPE23]|nr:hypothetical protein M9434_001580 [Picochlorum sp. BPE23]